MRQLEKWKLPLGVAGHRAEWSFSGGHPNRRFSRFMLECGGDRHGRCFPRIGLGSVREAAGGRLRVGQRGAVVSLLQTPEGTRTVPKTDITMPWLFLFWTSPHLPERTLIFNAPTALGLGAASGSTTPLTRQDDALEYISHVCRAVAQPYSHQNRSSVSGPADTIPSPLGTSVAAGLLRHRCLQRLLRTESSPIRHS